MKNIFLLISGILVMSLNSCTKSIKNHPDTSSNQEQQIENYINETHSELTSFFQHAKNCKTEYEVESFINQLPQMKQGKIALFGSEQNWEKYLAWLKINGSQKVIIDPRGVPIFYRTKHYPYLPQQETPPALNSNMK